jgi:hypothetical protein
LAAQLRVVTAVYLDFGNGIEDAGFDMLAPEITESNITGALGMC